ncbi:hypothetical protein JK628_03010 [Shewanella sp. KX20019]|uniref:phage tail assembly protein T n=1 Tax=Shewanella sp. KX20019 TaxID=2803864 RepID=UPI001925D100|nr:hypothetical protein [Shewanella sp. KX20019]QQX80860.1 hypothetical protein JK628_03010 [Shewanella sp. KX20019]
MKLGFFNIDEMLASGSSSHLLAWMEFFNEEPWGAEIEDYHFGLVSSVLANCHRGKDTQPFKPSDFMLKSSADSEPQTVDEQLSILNAMVDQTNGSNQ